MDCGKHHPPGLNDAETLKKMDAVMVEGVKRYMIRIIEWRI